MEQEYKCEAGNALTLCTEAYIVTEASKTDKTVILILVLVSTYLAFFQYNYYYIVSQNLNQIFLIDHRRKIKTTPKEMM